MAKKEKGTNLYLLAIVSIVAIVGIVMLVLNVGKSGTVSLSAEDLSGQAIEVSTLEITPMNQDDCVECSEDGEMACGVPCSVKG